MDSCVQCGHTLGPGRFCTNCGHPIDRDAWRTDTAERPAVSVPDVDPPTVERPTVERPTVERPTVDPPTVERPAVARFPLYADPPPRTAVPTPGAPADDEPQTQLIEALSDDGGDRPDDVRGLGGGTAWLVGASVLVLAAGVGAYLLLGGTTNGGSDPGRTGGVTDTATSHPGKHSTSKGSRHPRSASAGPPSSGRTASAGEVGDVTRLAEVAAPPSAPPEPDVSGNAVRYVAFNLIDGVPDTAWRMVGDGTGQQVVLTLDAPTTVTSVGLINGYAKRVPGYDGYHANRRITAVHWTFDDGTSVAQALHATRRLQSIPIGDVRTSTVTLDIDAVTGPVVGTTGSDYTAISDLDVVGSVG